MIDTYGLHYLVRCDRCPWSLVYAGEGFLEEAREFARTNGWAHRYKPGPVPRGAKPEDLCPDCLAKEPGMAWSYDHEVAVSINSKERKLWERAKLAWAVLRGRWVVVAVKLATRDRTRLKVNGVQTSPARYGVASVKP